MKHIQMQIIRDVHAEYHIETNTVKLIAEHLDGEEEVMAEFMPENTPTFSIEAVPIESSDYEDYYNLALEEAHKRGFILEGEY